jgi:hypothetical protein
MDDKQITRGNLKFILLREIILKALSTADFKARKKWNKCFVEILANHKLNLEFPSAFFY